MLRRFVDRISSVLVFKWVIFLIMVVQTIIEEERRNVVGGWMGGGWSEEC